MFIPSRGAKAQHRLFLPRKWCDNWTHFAMVMSEFLVQFSSVTQSCLILCNPMDYSTPDFPVYHQLPELTQIHVHWFSDAIQPPHPLPALLLPPSTFLSIRVFSSESVLHITWPSASASDFPMNIQVWLLWGFTGLISLLPKGCLRVFSNSTVQKHQLFSTQLSLYFNSHLHIYPFSHWKNHSFD